MLMYDFVGIVVREKFTIVVVDAILCIYDRSSEIMFNIQFY